jgi:hypothetical protein
MYLAATLEVATKLGRVLIALEFITLRRRRCSLGVCGIPQIAGPKVQTSDPVLRLVDIHAFLVIAQQFAAILRCFLLLSYSK